MAKTKARFLSVLLIAVLILPCLLVSPALAAEHPLTTSDSEIIDALDYLRGEQTTTGAIGSFADSAWVVMAIKAAGEDPNDWQVDTNPSIVDYLETNASSAEIANDYSRMILAIVAAEEDPTDFGGEDFVAQLQAEYDGTQIGDEGLLNDDFWGVMALIAAGEDPESTIIQDSVAFILAEQNADGGWGWSIGEDNSDVDDTGAAIMALIAAGEDPGSGPIANGLAYIKDMQTVNGGFESWGATNADTDSWGIEAIVAAGQDPTDEDWQSEQDNDPVDDLLGFQQEGGDDNGAFYWQIGTPGAWPSQTTAKAIIALLGEYFPVAVLEPPPEEGVTVDVRIEGEDDTIWSGTVTVTESWITADNSGIEYHLEDPTAMGALDEASKEGDFPYETTDQWGTLFITSIDDEEPEAPAGWMYWVDYVSPGVGAADFILDETSPPEPPHQEVLFALCEWTDLPLKVEVDDTEPDVGEDFTVTVSAYDGGEWLPVEDATVYADITYLSDENGEVETTIYHDATIDVYAEKDGYIRSNQVTVTVGEGSAQPSEGRNVNLTVDIIPAISFSVTPDYINFGLLGPRDVSEPVSITLTNEGAWRLFITTIVTDDADNLYVSGLKLDNLKWDEFEGIVSRDDSKVYTVTLTVPETYTLTGEQNGTIIFWAAEAS